ncbi:MAG: hypothetical protein QOF56_2065, partial [Acidobacteriaceae bacterium]|nr:hypothetical protein [Acidobacteriaceae bacterium]
LDYAFTEASTIRFGDALVTKSVSNPECREYGPPRETPGLSCCEAIYACVAGFALKMPLKLSRY